MSSFQQMSDYTAYVRGQLEERKKSQTGRFMKDGFDRWAESSTPARAGQMEKEPSEATDTMSRQIGSGMSEKFLTRRGYVDSEDQGGILPLAIAAAPYVLPAAAGLATGIYAGVKGERKVQKMRQQIAREERAKRGGLGLRAYARTPAPYVPPVDEYATGDLVGPKGRRKVDGSKRGGILPLLPAAAVAAAPYILPAAAGFATGIYAGVKGQRKVDALRQQIAREESAKTRGLGFREGVRETQTMYGNVADAAVYGYDAYESAQKGVSGLPGALRSGAKVAESVMKVKDSAKKAADEFQKGGRMCGSGKTDGRSARAAIVKKVMAERGVKMIEASKIVKAEGLY